MKLQDRSVFRYARTKIHPFGALAEISAHIHYSVDLYVFIRNAKIQPVFNCLKTEKSLAHQRRRDKALIAG